MVGLVVHSPDQRAHLGELVDSQRKAERPQEEMDKVVGWEIPALEVARWWSWRKGVVTWLPSHTQVG